MDLLPLDVIWIHDDLIRPPGPKMMVCAEPNEGLFFRINTDPHWKTPILLQKKDVHEFLTHDSYLECGDPIELDEYVLEQNSFGNDPIGAIASSLIPQIVAAVSKAVTLSPDLKNKIYVALGDDPTSKPTA